MSDTPRMDAYPMAVVERAIHEALHPHGASTHDGKMKLDCSHVMSIIARGRTVERELSDLRAKLAAVEKVQETPAAWMYRCYEDEWGAWELSFSRPFQFDKGATLEMYHEQYPLYAAIEKEKKHG